MLIQDIWINLAYFCIQDRKLELTKLTKVTGCPFSKVLFDVLVAG